MGIPGARGPPSLLCGGERCSLVGGEWGRVGLNECLLSYWLLGTRSQEQQVPVVPPKALPPPVSSPPSHTPATPNCLSFFTGRRRFLISVTLSLCPLCQDGTRSLRPG